MATDSSTPDSPLDPPEPRWPAIVAVLAVGGINLALPESLAVGPRWLQLVVVIILLIPTVITHRRGHHDLNKIIGHILAAVITLFMVWSLTLLVLSELGALPREEPAKMLRSAAALWFTNILVFAYWYWRLDAGGPNARDMRLGHPSGAFLFPQMTLDEKKSAPNEFPWSPEFIDYLFLAFNTSTAFSPTDAPILSRWAKVLIMLQSLISLTVVAVLGARAINILT